ncbi:MAG: hypothetical protein ACLFV8_11920 [Alphaproteobacteria bacterium]
MGEVLSGVGQFISGNFQAEEAKREAQLLEIQADEVSAALTGELNETLGNIDAALAISGRDPTSPTASALSRKTAEAGARNISTERVNRLTRAAAIRRGGKAARTQGIIGLAGGVVGTAADVATGLAQPTTFTSRRVG